jgi:DNA-binding transcriptional LysR family regulator
LDVLTSVRSADVNLLQVFVAVAETGGFAAAQHRLGTSASTIGTQIAHLEARIGLRLCERGRSGFRLTEEGEIVLASAYELFREHERFSRNIYSLEKEVVGRVRIAVIDGLVRNTSLRLSECIADLRKNYPRIQFELQQSGNGPLEQKILAGETDLAITWMPSSLPSLSARLLFEEEEIICCGRGHPLFERAPNDITDEELEKFDWVTDGFALPNSVPFSIPPISTAMTASIEGIAYFVLAGTHIAYLSKPYAKQWIDEDLIRPILPNKFGFKLPISIVSQRALARDKKTAVTRDVFLELHKV